MASDPSSDRLDQLERANAQLHTQLQELREIIDRTRVGGFRSIRDSRRCPACGSGALLHVRRAQEVGYGGLKDLAIAHERSTWKGFLPRGSMESFACRGCGLVEFHVIDFSDVPVDGTDIVAIDPEPDVPSDGPFR